MGDAVLPNPSLCFLNDGHTLPPLPADPFSHFFTPTLKGVGKVASGGIITHTFTIDVFLPSNTSFRLLTLVDANGKVGNWESVGDSIDFSSIESKMNAIGMVETEMAERVKEVVDVSIFFDASQSTDLIIIVTIPSSPNSSNSLDHLSRGGTERRSFDLSPIAFIMMVVLFHYDY